MNPKDRDATIRTCLELLTRSGSGTMSLANAVRLLEASDVRDSALRSGMGSTGAPSHGDIDYSDPTGNTATRGMSSAGQQTIDGIDLRLARILVDLTWIDTERGKACRAPKDPRPEQKPMDGCTSCHRDNGAWEPIYDKVPGKHLCRWCYDVLIEHGRRPAIELVRMHRQGKRISRNDFDRYMPAETTAEVDNAPTDAVRSR